LERLLNPELGTEFADAHWVTFLQRCLTERDFGSRLVLTAQALPNALGDFRYRYPNVWEAKTLAGLSANEPQNEHLEFFGKHGVAMDKENQVILSKLGQVYEGHTLVLQVMSGEIQSKDFGGDVAQYWAVNQQEFEQVARSLDAKRLDETEYNDELDRRVRDRVKKSLQQLPPDAQDLLLRSSVYRRPVPKKFWLAMIDDRSASQQKEAYRVLSDRALVERENSQNHNLIRQHNLICDIAYNLLRQTVGIWETSERKAAYLWLTAYEATPGDSNLATVRGYLEAFEHYCEIKDWDTAKTILLEQVGLKLHIWGEYREMLNSFQKLTGNVTALDEVKCKRIIGNAYYFLGDYALATEFYQQSLNLAREVGDLAGEGTALGNLGNTYEYLGQHERAIDCHQQHMKIAQKNGDREGESLALSNLGLVHNCLGQYEKAIEFHQLAVIISCEIGDQAGEGRALGNLGLAYDRLGQYERAIEFYQRDLNIASKIGDRRGEGITLANMGALQIRLRDYPESLTCILSALTIFREIGARNREVEALKNLTELYQKLGKVKVARQYCEQALVLATELGIPLADECRKLREEIENSISISSG
jgi:tetratricopeptide (TPR) repeat protein